MNSTLLEPSAAGTTAPAWDDELFQLELRVARRADQLANGRGSSRGRDLETWFEAEREIFPLDVARESRG